MTDEEIDRMADNFVNAQYFTRVYSVSRKAECGAFWKHGFLAGLKAGKPKWHKAVDGDLPKKTAIYLVYKINGYGNKSIELIQYNSSKHFWCVDCQNEVIAWCEIPKYTKEEIK